MSEYIKIDRYDSKVVKGEVHIVAVAGKKEYDIPNAFRDMCDEDHLAIMQVKMEMGEVLGVPDTYYIPLRNASETVS